MIPGLSHLRSRSDGDAVYEQIMIDTFLRNGESELAAGSFGSDPLFAEGRTQIFGPLDT